VVAGLAIAFVALRWMSSLLFQVKAVDPLTYGIAIGAVTAIAWVASYLPSRRAAVVNPVNALRAE
jgi:ABC-type lipoprotein release transport system permease subunit